MKNIAVICECNPFHNGHAYLVKNLREKFDDARIVFIMSGNYTERQEMAIAPKFNRAYGALLGGADIVLELPYPFSSAGAEYFAASGVHIANSLGTIDYLAFGSECGDIEKIKEAAKNLRSREFLGELEKEDCKEKSYAVLREKVYKKLYGDAEILKSPNNILALEYVKALENEKSNIIPITVKRTGDGYNSSEINDKNITSASALRKLILDGNTEKIKNYMPHDVYLEYQKCVSEGVCPVNEDVMSVALLAYFRTCEPSTLEGIAEISGGLNYRICEAAKNARTYAEMLEMCATKKYTNTRIKRAVWNSYLGVKESDIKEKVHYTELLAANEKGRALLKEIKEKSDFKIFIRPAEYKNCDEKTKAQAEISHKADALYSLCKKNAGTAFEYISSTPYVEK